MIGWPDSPGTWVGAEVPTHLHRSPARTLSRVALVASLAAALHHRSCLMHLNE